MFIYVVIVIIIGQQIIKILLNYLSFHIIIFLCKLITNFFIFIFKIEIFKNKYISIIIING